MAAAIVHDYLYWDQRCSKKEADNVLRLGMLESNVSPVQQYLVYGGVLAFGFGSWKDNAKLKASGESRFFSESYTEVVIRAPQDRLESLKRLQDEGRKVNGLLVLDDSNPDIVNACRAATAALQ